MFSLYKIQIIDKAKGMENYRFSSPKRVNGTSKTAKSRDSKLHMPNGRIHTAMSDKKRCVIDSNMSKINKPKEPWDTVGKIEAIEPLYNVDIIYDLVNVITYAKPGR